VIVGSYNQYFITSIVVIAVIVGIYNQYFITSMVVLATISTLSHLLLS
jgi:energy-converting hydrogenase Eha subunit B